MLDARCDAFLEQAGQETVRPEDREDFLRALFSLKRDLSAVFGSLRRRWGELSRDDALCRQAAELGIGPAAFDAILVGSAGSRRDGDRQAVAGIPPANLRPALTASARAAAVVDQPDLYARLDAFAEAVAERTRRLFEEAARSLHEALSPAPARDRASQAKAKATLRHFHDRFDAYDLVTLPLMIGRTGEGARVAVLRFSPEDATSLSDGGAEKLAGSRLHHFGAFFDRGWRRWDVMWGRLDAAELLIKSLLPKDHPLQAELLREAQIAILREELAAPTEVIQAITAELLGTADGKPPDPSVLSGLPRDSGTTLARRTVAAAVDPEAFLSRLNEAKGPPPGPDPGYTLEAGTRATSIIGNILRGMSDQRALGTAGRVLARLGAVGWGLLQIALPGVHWRLARWWISLVIALQVFLVVGGIVFNQPGATRLGWWSLGVTVTVVVLRGLLAEFLRLQGVGPRIKVVVGVVAAAILALAVYGGVRLVDGARGSVCDSENARVRNGTPFTCPPTTPSTR